MRPDRRERFRADGRARVARRSLAAERHGAVPDREDEVGGGERGQVGHATWMVARREGFGPVERRPAAAAASAPAAQSAIAKRPSTIRRTRHVAHACTAGAERVVANPRRPSGTFAAHGKIDPVGPRRKRRALHADADPAGRR